MTDSKGWAGARERLAQRPEDDPSGQAAPSEPSAEPLVDSPAGSAPAPPLEQEMASEPVGRPEGTAEATAEMAGEVDALVREAEADIAEDVGELERLAAERDDYMERLQRLQADFENYRKRVMRQQTEHLERAAEDLVEKLLAVLDTFDLALAHGEGYEQVHATLVGVLEKEGLERIDPLDQPFDPTEADAVAHEDADEGPVVSDVLRPGYRWKGRLLRPAMVKVRG